MTDSFDVEPEDSWDADDDPAVQLDNLVRRARLLDDLRPIDTLDDVALAVARARSRALTAREMVRADQLVVDVAYLRGRL